MALSYKNTPVHLLLLLLYKETNTVAFIFTEWMKKYIRMHNTRAVTSLRLLRSDRTQQRMHTWTVYFLAQPRRWGQFLYSEREVHVDSLQLPEVTK